jgi:hypothetical protein
MLEIHDTADTFSAVSGETSNMDITANIFGKLCESAYSFKETTQTNILYIMISMQFLYLEKVDSAPSTKQNIKKTL